MIFAVSLYLCTAYATLLESQIGPWNFFLFSLVRRILLQFGYLPKGAVCRFMHPHSINVRTAASKSSSTPAGFWKVLFMR